MYHYRNRVFQNLTGTFEKVDDVMREKSIEFYSKNINLVNESQILSNPIKFLINQGGRLI